MSRRFAFVVAIAFSALVVTSGSSAAPTELFISEYIEGSSNNKALEIYNGTGAAVNLAAGGYDVQMFFNGSATAGPHDQLTGTVADGDVYVRRPVGANATILAQADQTNGAGWFNGDDAVVLREGAARSSTSIGQVGVDPGTEWGSAWPAPPTTRCAERRPSRRRHRRADAFDPVARVGRLRHRHGRRPGRSHRRRRATPRRTSQRAAPPTARPASRGRHRQGDVHGAGHRGRATVPLDCARASRRRRGGAVVRPPHARPGGRPGRRRGVHA